MAEFPRLASWRDHLRFSRRIEVPFDLLTPDELRFLERQYAGEGAAGAGQASQLAALVRACSGDDRRFGPDDDLELVLPALARYLAKDAIRSWLFATNVPGKALAYVVHRLDFVPSSSEETGKVMIDLRADAKGALGTTTLRIAQTDISGRSIPEILAAKGFLKETPELIAAYDVATARYRDWRSRHGAQFSARGLGFFAEDPASSRRDTDWARRDVVVLSSGGGPARVVNDEAIVPPRAVTLEATGDVLGPYLRKAAKSDRYDAEDEVEAARSTIPEGLFTRCPTHGYMFVFHLDLHHHLWVHVDDMVPYAYRPDLKHRLVLPPEQTDLIDILTAEMDVLMDDLVAGKSGGTTVLCVGPAGVGKTLTAEVYSEIIQRPLYRVHSRQLGLSVGALEIALKEALTRAQRWGAVMLIDEADVYIKPHEDDMTMNAVVGVFLRVLEYFNGLLFLITNRVDDIDEAIVSRCIALIRFHPPDLEARRRIWRVMTEQFGLPVEASLIDALAHAFPTATGRDIKGLAKLVGKYCRQKDLPPTFNVFRLCSVFRGLDIVHPTGAPTAQRKEPTRRRPHDRHQRHSALTPGARGAPHQPRLQGRELCAWQVPVPG